MKTTMPECRIEIQPLGIRITALCGGSLHEILARAGIALAADCGGKGACGKCRIIARSEGLSEVADAERSLLTRQELEAGIRLACQCKVAADVRILIPASSMVASQCLQTEGSAQIHQVTKDDFDPVSGEDGFLGLAVDLGTTKIAGYLYHLKEGKLLASSGVMNPQISFGEDVISRMAVAAGSPQGPMQLSTPLKRAVNDLAERMAAEAGVSGKDISRICVVGNTAIMHLFQELSVSTLLSAPFEPVVRSAMLIPAGNMDLAVASDAALYIPPVVGGFVGADHVAMILATGIDRSDTPVLGIDIGTNTEIVLYLPEQNRLCCVSCASGPAFEGATIKHGMRAADGAIETVRISGSRLEFNTIGNAPPLGLCGSGIVDSVASMLRLGILDEMGHLNRDTEAVRKGEDGYEYVLAPASLSGNGQDIVVTQKDVCQIQLAKGAIRTGIDCLLEATGTSCETVQQVVMAGAFGCHMDLDSAADIGLLPRFSHAGYTWAGNAAGVGACMMMASSKYRQRAEQIAKTAKFINLKEHPGFNRHFAMSLRFHSFKKMMG